MSVDLCDSDFVDRSSASSSPRRSSTTASSPSAPYSMIDREHAVFTQNNNVDRHLNVIFAIGELDPDCHLVKLGTMGEYGPPNIDIEEGWLEIEHKGRKDRLLFPKKPGQLVPPPARCRLDTTSTSPAGSGACGPPTSTRASSTASTPTRRVLDDAAAHPLRLRRAVRHRAQPLLRSRPSSATR